MVVGNEGELVVTGSWFESSVDFDVTLRREEIEEGGGGSDGDLLWSLVASSWGCGETMSGVFGTELLMCQEA